MSFEKLSVYKISKNNFDFIFTVNSSNYVAIILCVFSISTPQRLLRSCDFDSGSVDFCRFTNTPGAPDFEIVSGFPSNSPATVPLSDVTAISEFCL